MEFKLKLADVNLVLGEVGLESGVETNLNHFKNLFKTHSPLPLDQTEQAIADIQAGLALRKEVLEPTDRRVAEALVNVQ